MNRRIVRIRATTPASDASDWRRRIERRARRVNLDVDPRTLAQVATYVSLLSSWNERINLTALDDRDAAVDRLLLEPLLAARLLAEPAASLIDIGSGGGSPAIPLRLAMPGSALCMVESKTRKGAFLREAIRQLGLKEVRVEARRFEELLAEPAYHEAWAMLSIRAVRVSVETLVSLQAFVRPGGRLLLFRSAGSAPLLLPPMLVLEGDDPLVESLRSRLIRLRKRMI